MTASSSDPLLAKTQSLIDQMVQRFCEQYETVGNLATRMINEASVRMVDLVDHVGVTAGFKWEDEPIDHVLVGVGFVAVESDAKGTWFAHPDYRLPRILVAKGSKSRLALRVDSVSDFVFTHHTQSKIIGRPSSRFRKAQISQNFDFEFWVCERHGWESWNESDESNDEIVMAQEVFDSFRLRRRNFDCDRQGVRTTERLIKTAVSKIDANWVSHLFFRAEREYWHSRSFAAQTFAFMLQRLGIGWALVDRHVIRCQRTHLPVALSAMEAMGCKVSEAHPPCHIKERAVVTLENELRSVQVSIEVDAEQDELTNEFPCVELEASQVMGAVDLWCQIHGNGLLQAGLAQLDCRVDLQKANEILTTQHVATYEAIRWSDSFARKMSVGQIWSVLAYRVEQAVEKDTISRALADKYFANGAAGSALGLVERNHGWQDFFGRQTTSEPDDVPPLEEPNPVQMV